MHQNTTLRVGLVKPEIWQPLVKDQLNPLPFKARRAAQSIIRTMHNRHVGITPALAAQLARLITEPGAASHAEGAWANILKRLTRELETRKQGFGVRLGFGVLLSAAPPYSVIRLAMPIIEEAAKRIRLCCLFCEDPEGSVSLEGYKKYAHMLSHEISRMTEMEDDYFNLFWQERALTLANYSRRHSLWGDVSGNLPETDPAAAGIMLRLKPNVPGIPHSSRTPKHAFSRLKYKESVKYREGGFSGIRITGRPEDMEDILMSEFLNPPILLADRLINSGYLALKRKPKHQKLKDVLMVGLMPHQVKPDFNAHFIKSCWFDFVSRIGLLLCRLRLMRSRFLWLESDGLDRSRTCQFLLEDLPLPEVPQEQDPTPAYRQSFLAALGWMPTFLDTRGDYDPVPERSAAMEDDVDPALRWAASAWKNLVLQHKKNPSEAIDSFAFVHIQIFLPAAPPDAEPIPSAARLAQLHRLLDFPKTPGRSISITHIPEKTTDIGKWTVHRPGCVDARLFPGHSQAPPWEDIAGRLEQVWLEHMVEEIRNG